MVSTEPVEVEAEEYEQIVERVAAIDVAKKRKSPDLRGFHKSCGTRTRTLTPGSRVRSKPVARALDPSQIMSESRENALKIGLREVGRTGASGGEVVPFLFPFELPSAGRSTSCYL